MVVLALDTTTREGSIAVVRDGVLLDTFTGDASVTHGERLPRDLVRVLERSALELGNVDVFAVAAGPGSFTGLRIGIAAMQGLALATGQSLVGVSALDAIHDAVRSRSPQSFAVGAVSQVVAWMDAQRGQVFSAVYRESGLIEGPVVDLPEPILARWCSARGNEDERLFAGDGAIAVSGRHPTRTTGCADCRGRATARPKHCPVGRGAGSRTRCDSSRHYPPHLHPAG